MTESHRTSPGQSKPKSRPKLRWFQFGLRTLLILMTLVCVGLAWLIHDVREQEAVVKMIEELDGVVEFGESSFLGRLGFVCSLFDERTFRPIKGVQLGPRTTDAQLVQLKKLKKLNWLLLDGTQVSDLSPLAELHGLITLSLEGTQVSDLSPLAGLSGLTLLDLERTQVSDLSPLSGLSGLTSLDLCDTQVSDLSPLAGLKNLEAIYLGKDQEVLVPDSLEMVVIRF